MRTVRRSLRRAWQMITWPLSGHIIFALATGIACGIVVGVGALGERPDFGVERVEHRGPSQCSGVLRACGAAVHAWAYPEA